MKLTELDLTLEQAIEKFGGKHEIDFLAEFHSSEAEYREELSTLRAELAAGDLDDHRIPGAHARIEKIEAILSQEV